MKLAMLPRLRSWGWYLMVPPWVSYATFDAGAPISKWKQSNAYDSAAECEQDRSTLIKSFQDHPKAKDANWFERLYTGSEYIETDDLRLKSN